MTVLEESLYRPVMTTGPFAGRRFVREARIADWMLCTKRIDLVCTVNPRVRACGQLWTRGSDGPAPLPPLPAGKCGGADSM